MERRFLTRRELLLTAGAAALAGFSGSRAADTIVVGAGPAGIAAARTLRAHGHSVVLLEAAPHIGSRATGASYLSGHGALYEAAIHNGASSIAARERTPAPAGRRGAFLSTYASLLAAALALGDRIADGTMADVSTRDAVRELQHLPHFEAALAMIGGGAAAQSASLLDFHRHGSYAMAPFAFSSHTVRYVASGIGSLMARLADGLPFVANASVTSIAYDRDAVVARTQAGAVYRAQKAVVTVPAAALTRGAIAFSPALPQAHRSAIDALPMTAAPFGGETTFATVGNASARVALAKPIGNTLWFAGEATAPPGQAPLEGAWQAGINAALEALSS